MTPSTWTGLDPASHCCPAKAGLAPAAPDRVHAVLVANAGVGGVNGIVIGSVAVVA